MALNGVFWYAISFIIAPLWLCFSTVMEKVVRHLTTNKDEPSVYKDDDSFDLSQFLSDSLSLQVNVVPAGRMSHSRKYNDPYENLFKREPLEVLEGTGFQTPEKIPEQVVGTPVQEFYRGADVFISGGTGFMGKILTEKLVRSVPHIGNIYLLIRAKRGKTPEERFQKLLDDQIFRRMKKEVPDYQSKIKFVSGDISEPSLGLSAVDRQLLVERVSVVFHGAADVRFIEPLGEAMSSNVLGSQRMLELAKEMTHLKAYVHVSTAYSQCVRRVVPESVPKLSINYKDVLRLLETMTEQEVSDNLVRIMQGWPNTYTFSKALCEDMIQDEKEDVPVCIFRPSAVVTTSKEPVSGWTDNVYGPIGMILASALGIIHCYPQNEELALDMVPVDYSVNCMIACAWSLFCHKQKNSGVPVFNYVSSPANSISWKTVNQFASTHANKWPYQSSVWYFSVFFTLNALVDELAHIFLHKIPGAVLDKVAVWTGQRPRLTKIYDTLYVLKKHLKYFSNTVWEFESENVSSLWGKLSEDDKKVFFFDIKDINWKEHIMIGKLGTRYYYLKEKMETLPASERKCKRFFWAHMILKMVSALVVLKAMVFLSRIVPI